MSSGKASKKMVIQATASLSGSGNLVSTPTNSNIKPSETSSLNEPKPAVKPIVPPPSANQFSAKLSGSNEVPPIDSRASGTASFSSEADSISYKIVTSNMDDIVGAHLHRGGPGENGDVIVDLLKDIDMSSTEKGIVIGIFDDADLTGPLEGESIDEVIDFIKENNVYVNLHTADNLDGEIRGQVK